MTYSVMSYFEGKICFLPSVLEPFVNNTFEIYNDNSNNRENDNDNDNNKTDDKNYRNEKDYGMIKRNVYFIF